MTPAASTAVAPRRIGQALREGLARLGVSADLVAGSRRGRSPRETRPACFDGPGAHEIVSGGLKVIGSAQVRRRRAFLQHGSILLEPKIRNDKIVWECRVTGDIDQRYVFGGCRD